MCAHWRKKKVIISTHTYLNFLATAAASSHLNKFLRMGLGACLLLHQYMGRQMEQGGNTYVCSIGPRTRPFMLGSWVNPGLASQPNMISFLVGTSRLASARANLQLDSWLLAREKERKSLLHTSCMHAHVSNCSPKSILDVNITLNESLLRFTHGAWGDLPLLTSSIATLIIWHIGICVIV